MENVSGELVRGIRRLMAVWCLLSHVGFLTCINPTWWADLVAGVL